MIRLKKIIRKQLSDKNALDVKTRYLSKEKPIGIKDMEKILREQPIVDQHVKFIYTENYELDKLKEKAEKIIADYEHPKRHSGFIIRITWK